MPAGHDAASAVRPKTRTEIPEMPRPRVARGDLVHLQQTERLRRAHRRLT